MSYEPKGDSGYGQNENPKKKPIPEQSELPNMASTPVSTQIDSNELKGLEKKYGKEPEISEKQLWSWH